PHPSPRQASTADGADPLHPPHPLSRRPPRLTRLPPQTPPALAPRAVPREKHMRVPVPSIRRHRATSTKRVGRDMTFGGMIPRGRQSSGLRIIVLVRTGLLADQRAKKLLEERAKEKERIEKEERMVGGEMLDMAREERMEMMARKVKEVKRRRKGMDMDAVPGKKPKRYKYKAGRRVRRPTG
ncbi:hypothetical protein C8F01DRAFT_1343123, partial [Mycena amicta]